MILEFYKEIDVASVLTGKLESGVRAYVEVPAEFPLLYDALYYNRLYTIEELCMGSSVVRKLVEIDVDVATSSFARHLNKWQTFITDVPEEMATGKSFQYLNGLVPVNITERSNSCGVEVLFLVIAVPILMV
jgi:hypothetical protein